MNSPLNEFDETHPEFKGFNALYYEHIHPYLENIERERISAVDNARRVGGGIALFGFVAAFFVFQKLQTVPFSIFVAIGGCVLGYGTMYSRANKMSGEVKEFIMTSICHHIGWQYTKSGFPDPDLTMWQWNKILPKHDRVSYEDQMTGHAHGRDFIFCEAHLEREHRDKDGDTHWSTTFRGILLEIDSGREFLGRTIVLRDAGLFNRKQKANMKRIGLADPVFEKIFEAYGTDQVEARYLLTPDFMQRLVDLEIAVSGKKIRVGFLRRKLYVAVEAPNQFEIGSLIKTLLDTTRTQRILNEIGAILDVIDGIAKPIKRRH